MNHSRRVEILDKNPVFEQSFFRIEQARLRYERFDGTMSEPLVRLNFDRGDAAAAVVHDPSADTVVLVEQFRYPTLAQDSGWTLELPAGVIETHENTDPEATIRRELIEEIGYQVAELRPIHTFYVSPGGSSERIFLFYAPVSPQDRRSHGGGLASEQEDIRVHVLPAAAAFEKIASGEICDAKTIIGLQWLQLQRSR